MFSYSNIKVQKRFSVLVEAVRLALPVILDVWIVRMKQLKASQPIE